MSNDDIKSQIYNKASPFICGVDPYLLIQPLIAENVITLVEWKQIEEENDTNRRKCWKLYNYLKRSLHPRAFVIVKETLETHRHPFLNELEKRPTISNDGVVEHSAVHNDQAQPISIASLQDRVENLEKEREEALRQHIDLKQRFETLEALLQPGKRKRTDESPEAVTKMLNGNTSGIKGLTMLESELFVSFSQNPEIKVYDSTTYRLTRNIIVNGMGHPENMVSCSINKCLYVFDWYFKKKDKGPHILRIDKSKGAILTKWEPGVDGGRISVAGDSNIIQNVNMNYCLREFTADGELIRVINVGSGTGIINSWHAIKLRSGLFVVCHGGLEDPLNRVCLLRVKERNENQTNYDTEVVKVYDQPNLGCPGDMAIDDEESILMCDYEKNQIVLLDSSLKNSEHLILDGLDNPWRVCTHNSRKRRWLIADRERVFACSFKGKGNGVYEMEVKLDFSP